MKVYIYRITNSGNKEVCRYVGKTVNLKSRKYQHIYKAKKGYPSHLYNWMRKLWREGKEPIFEIIEECTEITWKSREKYWISYYGIENLTNIGLGGEGVEYPLKGFECIDTAFNTPEELINDINLRLSRGERQKDIENILKLTKGFISRARKHMKFSQGFLIQSSQHKSKGNGGATKGMKLKLTTPRKGVKRAKKVIRIRKQDKTITYLKDRDKWRLMHYVDGKIKQFGIYNTEEEARSHM